MVGVEVAARVKEGDVLVRYGVKAGEFGGLVKIARAAREGKVVERIRAAFGKGHDVLNFERKIERRFGCPAVFAAVASPRRNVGVVRVHRSTLPQRISKRLGAFL